MIQVTEFRIGNYLLVNDKLQTLSAICINGDNVLAEPLIGYITEGEVQYESSGSFYVKPVPLSDVILQKSGFAFHTYFKLWQKLKEVLGTGIDMELDRDHTALDFAHRPILKEIKYLHQLQNLYFALKRKELIVQLPLNEELLHPELIVS